MSAPDVTSAVERVRALIRVASREPQDGEPFTVDEDVMTDHLSDLRTILSELDRLSAALIAKEREVDGLTDPADCPAGHGDQCCRAADICRFALQQQEARDGRE